MCVVGVGAVEMCGSVGVVGTVLSTLIKKEQVKDRLKCTYKDITPQLGVLRKPVD